MSDLTNSDEWYAVVDMQVLHDVIEALREPSTPLADAVNKLESSMRDHDVQVVTVCGRCEDMIPDDDWEICWFCEQELCYKCWDDLGHCGHQEAEVENYKARTFYTPK